MDASNRLGLSAGSITTWTSLLNWLHQIVIVPSHGSVRHNDETARTRNSTLPSASTQPCFGSTIRYSGLYRTSKARGFRLRRLVMTRTCGVKSPAWIRRLLGDADHDIGPGLSDSREHLEFSSLVWSLLTPNLIKFESDLAEDLASKITPSKTNIYLLIMFNGSNYSTPEKWVRKI